MRILKTTFHGLGPYDHITLDWEAMAGPIVALNAPNGSGKTFAIESSTCGTCHREEAMPTQGKIAARSKSRDAYLETEIEYRGRWTIRHNLPKDITGSAVVTDSNGQPAYSGTGVKAFTAWAESHLPRRDVLEVTQLSAQERRGFLGLSPTERTKVILRCAGVYRVQLAAESSAKHARQCDSDAEALVRRIKDARESAPSELDALETLAKAESEATATEAAAARAELELAAAKELAGASATAELLYQERLTTWSDLRDRRNAARADLEESQGRLAAVDAAAAKVSSETAAEALSAAEKALLEAEELDKGLAVRLQAAKAAKEHRDRIQANLTEAEANLERSRKKLANNRGLLGKADEIRAIIAGRDHAIAKLPELQDAERKALADVESAQAALNALQSEKMVGAEGRIEWLRGALKDIAEGDPEPTIIAHEAIIGDDRRVAEAEGHPQKVVEATRKLAAAKKSASALTVSREAFAAASTKFHEHEKPFSEANGRIAELEGIITETSSLVEKLKKELETAPKPEAVPTAPDLAKLRSKVSEAKVAASASQTALAQALAATDELQRAITTKQVHFNALEEEFLAAQEPVRPESGPNIAALESAALSTKQAHSAAVSAIGQARQCVQQAKDAVANIARLTSEKEAIELEAADWKLLTQNLKSIANLEVDAAGPYLTETCNHILRTCHGNRFTVRVTTTRATKGGDEVDTCQVMVLDTVTNEEKEGLQFSGGEKGILNEAFSFSLTTFACARAELSSVTLFRDESGRDFDKANAVTYMKMLRLMASDPVIKIDKIILVTHDPELLPLCDSVIDLAAMKRLGEEQVVAA